MSSKEWIDEIPVMDIDAHSFSESAICSLRRACKEWGFFFIRNHGVPKEFFRKLISDADRRLFTFPDETKRKLKVGASSYTPRFVVSPSLESFKVLGPNFSASAIAHGFTDSLFGHQATQFRSPFLSFFFFSGFESERIVWMRRLQYDCQNKLTVPYEYEI